MADLERDDRGELRLLDVLLEQEFARERSEAPVVAVNRARSRWLAAALLLLGVGVVIGVVALRRGVGEARAVPVQQPQGEVKTIVVPPAVERPKQLLEQELKDGAEAQQQLLEVVRQAAKEFRPTVSVEPGTDVETLDISRGSSQLTAPRAIKMREPKDLAELDDMIAHAKALALAPFGTPDDNGYVSYRIYSVRSGEMPGWIADLLATTRGKPQAYLEDVSVSSIGLQLSDDSYLRGQLIPLPEPRLQFAGLSIAFVPTQNLLDRVYALDLHSSNPQDPVKRTATVENIDELDKLLQQVTAIVAAFSVAELEAGRALPFSYQVPPLSVATDDPTKFVTMGGEDSDLRWGTGISANGGAQATVQFDKREFDLLRPQSARSPIKIDAPNDVAAWVAELRATIDGAGVKAVPGEGMHIRLLLADGRFVSGLLFLSEQPRVCLANLPRMFAPSPTLLARMQELFKLAHEHDAASNAARANGFFARGYGRLGTVQTLAEVRGMLRLVQSMVISPKPDPKPGYRFDRSAPVPAGEFTAWMKDLGDTIEGKALEPISDSDFTFTLRHANGDLDGGMLALAPEPRVQFFGTAKSFEPTPSLLARMRAFAEGTEFMLGTGRLLPELLAKATQIRVRCLTLGEHDHPVDGAETTISDPKEIKELCDLFPAMEDGNTTLVPGNPQWTCRLEITLSDKRRLLVRFHLGKKPLLWHGMLQPVELESPAFIAKLAELQDLAERNGKAAREQAAWIREAKELDDVDALLTRAQSMVIVPIDDARSSNQGSSSGCMVPEEEMAGWIEDLRATIRGVPRAHLGDFRTNIGLTLSDGGTLSAQFTFLPEPRVQFYRLAKSFEPTPSLLARLRALKAPAQDPAQLIAFAENVEDMDKLLQQVKGITAVGGYIAVAVQDKGRVRPSHVFDARASVVIQDVNGWVTDLRASIRGETVSIAEGDGLRLNLVLTDGRVLTGTLMLSEPASIHLTNLPTTFAPTPSLLTRMQWLFSKAKEVQSAPDRPDFGVANNINDLPKIPADVKALRCPSPRASTVREQLHRFAALENLELVEQGLTQLPHGAIVAELAQLTTLRRLRLPGRMLDDDDANLLAAVPALTALRIDGGLKQLTERGMATLLRGKQAIEVVDVSDVAAVVRAAAAAGTVRRFAVFGDVDDATFAAIAALPGLEALGLGGVWCKDEHVAQLTATKLQELRLEYAAVTAAGLSELAKIATLRLLDLRRVHLPRADVEALQQTLPQVRIVAPWSPPGPPSLDDVPGATRK